ncbi:MAG: C-GCAxxG-C-C family protein [Oscillospiraceae bacterium]|nr:C-GCAxxG-C-C family protein [Oscillospiraceae bacterium]
MNRYEKANAYHKRGFNCCQSVLAAFSDLTGLSEQASFDIGGGFGGGAGTGELCGAISGAVMTLGMLTPVDPADPVGSKKRTLALSKELQKRFSEKFGALRCHDLLKNKFTPDDTTPAALRLGLTGHCDIMIVTAVELVEEMLQERG